MMPTTLSSGVALVTSGKGNSALALMLTVLSNLFAIGTIPFVAKLILSVSDVTIDPVPLLTKLIATILCPLLVGKGMQESSDGISTTSLTVSQTLAPPWEKPHSLPPSLPGVRAFSKSYKQQLGLVNNFSLILIAWMKLSQATHRHPHLDMHTEPLTSVT